MKPHFPTHSRTLAPAHSPSAHSLPALALTSLALLVGMPHALAGSTPPITAPPAPAPSVFKPQELQLDLFGVYGVGHAPDHAGPFREHAWGGGIGLNYFQENYFGIGIDADVKRGRENQATGTNRKTFEQYTASIIYRLPMEEYAMAPYFFFGGGLTSGVGTIASAHAGLGMEYRLIPNQVGLFADTRWTYYGDRYGRGDQNNVQIRSGIRFLF